MTIGKIAGILRAEVLLGEDMLDTEVNCVISSDLISDILVCDDENPFLITGLVNIQIVRAAEMIDLVAVVFVRGKNPQDDIIDYARDMGLPLLKTDFSMFEACGLVYGSGMRPGNFYIDEFDE